MKTPDQPAHPLTRDHTLLNAARAEITRLRAEVEQKRHLLVIAIKSAGDQATRAERAEAELAAAKERLRSEAMDDYASIKDLQRELATERARLDWLGSDAGVDWQWSDAAGGLVSRATVDAAMQEGAK